MTANQIAYHNMRETMRSNLAKEQETQRSNLAKEKETNRANLASEANSADYNEKYFKIGKDKNKIAKYEIDNVKVPQLYVNAYDADTRRRVGDADAALKKTQRGDIMMKNTSKFIRNIKDDVIAPLTGNAQEAGSLLLKYGLGG